jgi:hypothetical protein
VVSATDPHGRYLGFLEPEPLLDNEEIGRDIAFLKFHIDKSGIIQNCNQRSFLQNLLLI